MQGQGRLRDQPLGDRSPQQACVSRFRVPDLGIGVGYRVPHYRWVVEERPPMDWFEVLSENFMVDGGSPRYFLERLCDAYPAVPHGVSMNLGGVRDDEHLARLESLVRRIRPAWASDHLCWVGNAHIRSHDLLPVPFTRAMRDRVVDRVREVQDRLGIPFAIENPSSYLTYRDSVVEEWDFLAEVAEGADCALLLDVNNVFVSSFNHGFDPRRYLDALPLDRVVQVHLAGHSIQEGYRLDTHDAAVCPEVWELFEYVTERLGSVSTLIEWDGDIPTFERLSEEADRARFHRDEALKRRDARLAAEPAGPGAFVWPTRSECLPEDWQDRMLDTIRGEEPPQPEWFAGGPGLTPAEQVGVYMSQYRMRIYDALVADVPGLSRLLGDEAESVLWGYLKENPPRSWTLNRIADRLVPWLQARGAPGPHIEMARLDRAVMAGFEATDEEPLEPADLVDMPPLELQPHVSLLRLGYDVHAFRTLALFEDQEPEVDPGDFRVVIYRVKRRMRHLELDEGPFRLLELIDQGHEVSNALEQLITEGFDPAELAISLRDWFSQYASKGWVQRRGAGDGAPGATTDR